MEKVAKAAPKPPSKVFDISKPGKSMATATSRPVIVGNRPIMQDPMVAQADTSEPAVPTRSSSKVVIKPLSESDDKQASEKETKAAADESPKDAESKAVDSEKPEKPEEAAATPKVEKEAEKVQEEPAAPVAGDTETDSSDEALPEGTPPLDGTNAPDAKEAAKLEAEAKQQEEIDKLTESKEYFLPINSVEKHRSKVVAIFGSILIVVLGLLLVNLLLDVGVIRIEGVRPVTHFFSS